MYSSGEEDDRGGTANYSATGQSGMEHRGSGYRGAGGRGRGRYHERARSPYTLVVVVVLLLLFFFSCCVVVGYVVFFLVNSVAFN